MLALAFSKCKRRPAASLPIADALRWCAALPPAGLPFCAWRPDSGYARQQNPAVSRAAAGRYAEFRMQSAEKRVDFRVAFVRKRPPPLPV